MIKEIKESLNGAGHLPEGAQQWLGSLESLTEQLQNQQHNSQQMVQEWTNTYLQLLNTPASYITELAGQQQQAFQQHLQQNQQSFQQMVQQSMNSYMQLFSIPTSYAQEGLRIAQRATAEVPIEGYDEMNVAEISKMLDDPSVEELQRVHDYEKRNKNRETLLQQVDRRRHAAL